jgi:hypothetical protein
MYKNKYLKYKKKYLNLQKIMSGLAHKNKQISSSVTLKNPYHTFPMRTYKFYNDTPSSRCII